VCGAYSFGQITEAAKLIYIVERYLSIDEIGHLEEDDVDGTGKR
jgi:hypothetical protein